MWPWGEIELRRVAPSPNFDVALGVVAYGNRRMRQVRHRQHEFLQLSVQPGNLLVGALDLLGRALHFRQQIVGFLPGTLAARNLFAGLVAFGFPALRQGNEFAPRAIQRLEPFDIYAYSAIVGHFFEVRLMLTKIAEVMHGPTA